MPKSKKIYTEKTALMCEAWTKVKPSQRRLLELLERLDNARGCFAKRQTLADMLALSIHTVNKDVATLKKQEYLFTSTKGRGRNEPAIIRLSSKGRMFLDYWRTYQNQPLEHVPQAQPEPPKQKPKQAPKNKTKGTPTPHGANKKQSEYKQSLYNNTGVLHDFKILKGLLQNKIVLDAFKDFNPAVVFAAYQHSKHKQEVEKYMMRILNRCWVPEHHIRDAKYYFERLIDEQAPKAQPTPAPQPAPVEVIEEEPALTPKTELTEAQRREILRQQYLSDPRTAWKAQLM